MGSNNKKKLTRTLNVNILIANRFLVGDEKELFFDGEEVELYPTDTDFWTILVDYGIMTSRSECRRNNKPREIPDGFSEHVHGKLKHKITILKPTQDNLGGMNG